MRGSAGGTGSQIRWCGTRPNREEAGLKALRSRDASVKKRDQENMDKHNPNMFAPKDRITSTRLNK